MQVSMRYRFFGFLGLGFSQFSMAHISSLLGLLFVGDVSFLSYYFFRRQRIELAVSFLTRRLRQPIGV